MLYEIFVERPIKVEVEAKSYEEAIAAIKAQLRITDIELVKFSQAKEAEWKENEIKDTSEETK